MQNAAKWYKSLDTNTNQNHYLFWFRSNTKTETQIVWYLRPNVPESYLKGFFFFRKWDSFWNIPPKKYTKKLSWAWNTKTETQIVWYFRPNVPELFIKGVFFSESKIRFEISKIKLYQKTILSLKYQKRNANCLILSFKCSRIVFKRCFFSESEIRFEMSQKNYS